MFNNNEKINNFAIDEKDLKILDVLRKNSRLSTRKIAKKTNLPISTVHFRLRNLKKRVIKKFTISLDYSVLNIKFKAYILIKVDLKELKKKNKTQKDIIKKISKYNCVESTT